MLNSILKEGYASIKFMAKGTGKERTLIGTLNTSIIEKYLPKKEDDDKDALDVKEKKKQPDYITTVFCPLESGFWRAIDVNTLISFDEVSEKDFMIIKENVEKEREEKLKILTEKYNKYKSFLDEDEYILKYKDKEIVATTREDMVPVDNKPSDKVSTIRVYDIVKNKWVSIKVNDITDIEKY